MECGAADFWKAIGRKHTSVTREEEISMDNIESKKLNIAFYTTGQLMRMAEFGETDFI